MILHTKYQGFINQNVRTGKVDTSNAAYTSQMEQNYLWLPFYLRGAFGKFLAWSFISVNDLQTLSCLISF